MISSAKLQYPNLLRPPDSDTRVLQCKTQFTSVEIHLKAWAAFTYTRGRRQSENAGTFLLRMLYRHLRTGAVGPILLITKSLIRISPHANCIPSKIRQNMRERFP